MKSDLRAQKHHPRVVETVIAVLNESGDLGEETRKKLEISLRRKFSGVRAVNFVNDSLVIGIERKKGQIGVPSYMTIESHILNKQPNLKPDKNQEGTKDGFGEFEALELAS